MKDVDTTLKLTIELVPLSCWGQNLRSQVTKNRWKRIRQPYLEKFNNTCGICGSDHLIGLHEVWEYDDKQLTQRLAGFIPLCELCRYVKHIGRANILAKEGKLDYSKVISHFLTVNQCNLETFESHYKESFEIWGERSLHEWKLDLGEFKGVFPDKSMSTSENPVQEKL